MLKILQRLTDLLRIDVNINSPKTIIITKNSGNRLVYDKGTQELSLNYDLMNPEIKKCLSDLAKAQFDKGGLYESETQKELNNLYNYQKSNDDDNRILAFFKPIIPEDDCQALEVSLYLKKKFGEHKFDEVKKIKEDIRRRFGDRGNNISNLCTAGYFDNFFSTLYENSDEKKFRELYEVIVSKAAMAIFVHNQMDASQINLELERKIKISQKYRLPFIHLHGIGQHNIKIIENWVKDNKDALKFLKKDIVKKEGIMIVQILL